MQTRFRSFMAASRKPNMHAFGLFPTVDTLSWIESYTPAPGVLQSGAGEITGTINGTNDTFYLSEYGGEINLFVNGVLQIEGVDYSYSTGTGQVIFAAGSIPLTGSYLTALVYSLYSANSAFGNPPKVEIPAGTIDGTNADFTLVYTPGLLMLYYNGVLMKEGVDFTRTTNVITMLSPNVPASSVDRLMAIYW